MGRRTSNSERVKLYRRGSCPTAGGGGFATGGHLLYRGVMANVERIVDASDFQAVPLILFRANCKFFRALLGGIIVARISQSSVGFCTGRKRPARLRTT